MTHEETEKYLLSKPGAKLDYPFDKTTAVYKVGDKMFAIVAEGSSPLRISLKCDPQLAETLRDKYESVLPGYHLNKKHWNTVVLSGQLDNQEVFDLINHSYDLVFKSLDEDLRCQIEDLV